MPQYTPQYDVFSVRYTRQYTQRKTIAALHVAARPTQRTPHCTAMQRNASNQSVNGSKYFRLVHISSTKIVARMSVRDARVYTYTRIYVVYDKLSCTCLQNYTIGTSLMSVSVSVSWTSSFMQLASPLRELTCHIAGTPRDRHGHRHCHYRVIL